jgi:ABC-type phosphate transport system substrate-binding protein
MKNILAILLFISIIFSSWKPVATEIAIIVNKDNTVEQLTASEVKLYWLRKIKKRWPGINKNIKPADRKAKCPEQETFYTKVLNMTATDVETYFTQKQYESADKPQDKFPNDEAIISFVGGEPGAIGFVSTASLNASPNKSSVKVVLIVK